MLESQQSRLVALMEGRHPIVILGDTGEILRIAARIHDVLVQSQRAVEQRDRLRGPSQLVSGPGQRTERPRDETLPRGFRVLPGARSPEYTFGNRQRPRMSLERTGILSVRHLEIGELGVSHREV